MTLDEAIQNQEDIIKSCREKINDVKFINKTKLGKDIVSIQSSYIQECEQYIEWLKDYKRLLEQKPSEDCIARQPLIDNWNSCADMLMNEGDAEIVMGWIFDAPPVTPQQKIGRWIRWYEQKEKDRCVEYIPHCKCSECDKEYDPHSSQFIKFCYNCGAKMQEVEQ